MKLSVFDRLLIFLSMIVFFCIGIGLVVVYTVPGMNFSAVGYELDYIFAQPFGLLIVIAAALIFIFISIKLIITAFSTGHHVPAEGESDTRFVGSDKGASVLIKSTETGNIVISPSVIKELAIRKAKMSDKVKDVSCRVEQEESGSRLYMRFVLMADTKMDEFMVPMQEDIKKYVEDLTGTTVLSVEIRIEASEQKRRERVK